LLLILLCAAATAAADTSYYQHTFFDNSLTRDAYFYSSGKVSAPSTLQLRNGKLPIDTKVSFTPPNALRLEWKSAEGGGWDARIDVMRFRNRDIHLVGSNLYFWCYSAEGIPVAALPVLRVSDANSEFSGPLKLQSVTGDIPAARWVQIRIPLDKFSTASIHALDPHRLQSIIFSQAAPDGAPHTLLIDEIRIDDETASSSAAKNSTYPGTPNNSETAAASSSGAAPFGVKGAGFDFLRVVASKHQYESIPSRPFHKNSNCSTANLRVSGFVLTTLS